MVLDGMGLFQREVSRLEGESGYFVNVDSAGALQVGGEVTFPSAQEVTATLVGVSEVNIASTTGTIDITGEVTFPSAQEVTIENAGAISVDASGSTVPISVAGTLNVDASGSTVPISHSGDLDVNITNSSLSMTGSVTFPSAQSVSIADASIAVTQSGDFNITDVDEIELLAERWQQTGSTLTSLSEDYSVGSGSQTGTLHTVTASKDFFIKKVIWQPRNDISTDTHELYLEDNGGDTLLTFNNDGTSKGDNNNWDFFCPIKIGTSLTWSKGSSSLNGILTVVGWEE